MTFKEVLLERPELSYTKDHPTDQAARKKIYLELEDEKAHSSYWAHESGGLGLLICV
ncbi:hypothetical protein QW180_31450 [Vibrio sinaloensis]|nr:hypothetical protein [Vibrio sinaloensis]